LIVVADYIDCPTCGKSLTTEQGMGQHHTKAHGDPVPNRTCKGRETDFYGPKARTRTVTHSAT
jgi:hypothetical protein